MNYLPIAIYENWVEPAVGDLFYVVPENDSVIAERMEVTEVSGRSFTAGGYTFAWTGSVGHVGKSVAANAYDSEAACNAVKMIPRQGWTQHERRKDVFFRVYVNTKVSPPIKRAAYIQFDHRDGKFLMLGHFLGEGVNMLARLSEESNIGMNDPASAYKIRDYLAKADGIILASYAMNVTKEAALNSARQVRDGNFDRGAE